MVHDAFLRADHVFSRKEIEVNFIKVNARTLKKENSRNVNRILSTKMCLISFYSGRGNMCWVLYFTKKMRRIEKTGFIIFALAATFCYVRLGDVFSVLSVFSVFYAPFFLMNSGRSCISSYFVD